MKNEKSEKENGKSKKEEDTFVFAIILVAVLSLGVIFIILKVIGLF